MIYIFKNDNIPLDDSGKTGIYLKNNRIRDLDIDSVIVQSEHIEKTNRTELQELLDKVYSGDVIITSSLVNFSRNFMPMLVILNGFLTKGIRVVAPMEEYDSDKYKDKSWLGQYEWLKKYDDNNKTVLKINQHKGIEKAKLEGKFQGHDAAKIENYEDFDRYYELLSARKITKIKMAADLGVSRPTLDKMLKQKKSKE